MPRASSKSKKAAAAAAPAPAKPSITPRPSGAIGEAPLHLRPLYPTVAISDLYFAVANFVAAYLLWTKLGAVPAALGFSIVGIACSFGVLGFGVSSYYFATINSYFAETSAFVGLPLVGLTLNPSFGRAQVAALVGAQNADVVLAVTLMIIHTIIRGGASDQVRELARVPFNLVCFIGPLGCQAYAKSDLQIVAALVMIIFAGVGVGKVTDRKTLFLGMFLRENVFHYLMGTATILLGLRLTA